MQVPGDGIKHVLDVRRADAQERAGGNNRSRMVHGSPESDPRDLERLAFFRPDDARPRLAAELVNGGIGDVRTDKRVAGADLAHGITPACARNASHEQAAVLHMLAMERPLPSRCFCLAADSGCHGVPVEGSALFWKARAEASTMISDRARMVGVVSVRDAMSLPRAARNASSDMLILNKFAH